MHFCLRHCGHLRPRKCIFVFVFVLISLFSVFSSSVCHADDTNTFDIKLRAGYSIGATAPLGIPATIRSIDAYRLTPSIMIGADLSKKFSSGTPTSSWASSFSFNIGLHLQNKAMDAEVTTKGYPMEIVKGDNLINGLFTGHVKQQVSQWMLTLPLQILIPLHENLSLKAGPYLSLLLHKEFSGIAFDGYIRQGDPTGPRIDIGNVEGEWATYDFSDQMRSLQWGLTAGIDWQPLPHFGFSADIEWGLSGIFKNDFETIAQTLYPIYANLGLFYKF